MTKFVDNMFSESFISTIGVDFKIKTIELDGKRYKLQIWDTAGQDRFRTITSGYYRGAHGIFIVYDITDEQSFNNVLKWCQEIDRYSTCKVIKILIGNKIDLKSKQVISSKQIKKLADSMNIEFFETSAKTGVNVDIIFTTLCKLIENNIH